MWCAACGRAKQACRLGVRGEEEARGVGVAVGGAKVAGRRAGGGGGVACQRWLVAVSAHLRASYGLAQRS